MADQTLTASTLAKASAHPLDGNEVVRLVDDPSGSPVSKRATIDNIKSYVLAGVVDPPTAISGQSFQSAVSKSQGIASQIGDSNTDDAAGRPGWQAAVNLEWIVPGGIFEGWTVYNNGQNGSTLAGWVAQIGAGDTGAAATARNNPWAAVNANPDVVIIALGTNDLNSPANRATIGTKPNLQANLDTLVEFLLDNTTAAIWLRLPQPFAFEDFLGVTDWADADEAAGASQIMREVYESWVGRTPRVEVFNSHRQLFGLRCDDKATDCLDPVTSLPMLEDSLHCTNIGFRRFVERMHYQARGVGWKVPSILRTTNLIAQASSWSTVVYAEVVSGGTNSTLNIRGNPSNVRNGATMLMTSNVRTTPSHDLTRLEDYFLVGHMSAIKELRFMRGRGGVKLYFPASGNSYTSTDVTLSQIVNGGGDDVYYQFSFTNCDLTGEVPGTVLIYSEQRHQHPFNTDAYITLNVVSGETQTLGCFRNDAWLNRKIVEGTMVRSAFSGVTGAADAYLVTVNNGVITGTLMGTFTFGAGIARTTFTINTTNYPSGISVGQGEYIIRMAGYSNIGQGQVNFLTRSDV